MTTRAPHNGRIAVLCPTRGKPELFARFALSVTGPLTDIVYYVADDDPERERYLAQAITLPATLYVGPPLGYAQGTNYLAAQCPSAMGYFTGEDDYLCIHADWAKDYLAALPPDGVALVYDPCEDALGDRPHTAMFGWGWVRALQIIPAPVAHYCLFEIWAGLANAIGRKVRLAERYFEHHQQRAAGVASDETPDRAILTSWMLREFDHAIDALAGAIALGGTP